VPLIGRVSILRWALSRRNRSGDADTIALPEPSSMNAA